MGFLSDDNSQVKITLRNIWYFTIGWKFQVLYPNNVEVSDDCYSWQFLQRYNFVDRGTIKVTMDMNRNVCSDEINFSEN